jgi:hypothetical protein
MGRVIGRAFEVFGRNAGPFLLIAFVLAGLPAFLQQMVLAPASPVQAGAFGAQIVLGFVFSLLKLVLTFVLQGALVTGAVADLNGKKVDLGDMLRRGGSAFLPLLGLAILETLAIGLGFVVLIVPGLILATTWIASIPALVVERTGVFGAFNRSSDLTRGHRWAVFGLIMIYAVIVWIISAAGGAIMIGLSGGLQNMVNGSHWPLIGFSVVFATVFGAIGATAASALYYELRLAREGVAPQTVFETFT